MLRFFHGQLSRDYSFSFEPSVFNTREHLQLQSATGWDSFYTIDDEIKKVEAAIHFTIKDQIASSPLRAPFGGLELTDELTEKQVSDFVEFVVRELNSMGIKKVIIKQPPSVNEDSRIVNLFLKVGFKIKLSEVDSFINVEGEFSDRLRERNKQRKLRNLRKKNWDFKIQDHSLLGESYNFILKCRNSKGYSLSMTLAQVEQLAKTLPERVFLFLVLDRGKMIAASICLKIKGNWLYDFYHDHDPDFDADSPVLFLIDGIFDFCKANGIDWIELGTSMYGAEVNKGLLEFKERLGATTVFKNTFVKEF